MFRARGGAEDMKVARRSATTLSGQRTGSLPQFVVVLAASRGIGLVAPPRGLAMIVLGLVTAMATACNDSHPVSQSSTATATYQPSTPSTEQAPVNQPVASAMPEPTSAAAGPVSGMVIWPDGNPARGVRIALFPYNHRSAYSLSENPEYDINTDRSGRYTVQMCPCASLNAWLTILSFDSAFNNGNSCMIKMTPDGQHYTGVPAQPGQQINWMIGPKSCDRMLLEFDSAHDDPSAATWRQAERWSLTH